MIFHMKRLDEKLNPPFSNSNQLEKKKIILMERRLYEASVNGDVSSLNQLMQEDGLALARTSTTCFDETPLHIAAMLGHTDFAAVLLKHRPGLASEQDSRGLSALHSAAANGYVDVVRLLLSVDHNMCLAKDEDGRNPLDMAVMKGRALVVEELLLSRPEMARCVSDRGETLLHLAVKHNRLETIKVLVELGKVYGTAGPENEKDDDGNTVLHFAASLKQTETVKYLLSKTGIQVNAANRNGLTALDMLENMPRDLRTMEIREALMDAGALHSKKGKTRAHDQVASATEIQQVVTNPQIIEKKQEQSKGDRSRKEKQRDRLQKRVDALMVAASVLASMAYQAAIQLPGGFIDGGSDKDDNVGKSVLAIYEPGKYDVFWALSTFSFLSSMSTMFLIVSGLSLNRRALVSLLMAIMWLTLTSMTAQYIYTVFITTPEEMVCALFINSCSKSEPQGKSGKPDPWIPKIISIATLAWVALVGIVFLVKLVCGIIWAIRKLYKLVKKLFSRQHLHQRHGSV